MHSKTFALITIILVFSSSVFSQTGRKAKKTEVFVLSTLHQFHATSKYYSFDRLARVVEGLHPDILAVELTASDLASRKEQKTKQEYQKSIFPLIDKHKYRAVPLEPSEPDYSQLVSLIRSSDAQLFARSPAAAASFVKYSDALYAELFAMWDSPLSVNSKCTDAMFEVKHRYQNSIYDERQTQGWEGWNQHFLDVILDSAQKNAGKRIVVTVGAEHGYWLRAKLRESKGVTLLEAEQYLRKL